jgi:glycosyltransferase involved in cell wall biosynthesis
LKEGGDPTAALEAYKLAEVAAPDDSDVKIQIGHALKIQGDLVGAADYYRKALLIDPNNRHIYKDLQSAIQDQEEFTQRDLVAGSRGVFEPEIEAALNGGPTLRRPIAARNIEDLHLHQPSRESYYVYDITDLVRYLAHSSSPTGIQRVQLEVIAATLFGAAISKVALVAYSVEIEAWVHIPTNLFLGVYNQTIQSTDFEDLKIDAIAPLSALYASSRKPFQFIEGDVLFSLGTSWGLINYSNNVARLRKSPGISFVQYIHDCIPLIMPHYCDNNTVHEFRRWFSSISYISDGVIANSNNTLRDFHRFQRRLHGKICVPSKTIFLNGAKTFESSSGYFPSYLIPQRPYVLFVSTIEPRKDHGFVFDSWKELAIRQGYKQVPLLVCVGRVGWKVDELLRSVKEDEFLKDNIEIREGISDLELDNLYRNCLFTVYNSLYEGWGLPVSESISYGKVPVCPAHTGLLDSGKGAAVYYPVSSSEPFITAVLSMVTSPELRKMREAQMNSLNPLRPWSAIAEEIVECLLDARLRSKSPNQCQMAFRIGKLYRAILPEQPELNDYLAVDVALIGDGWHHPEPWGTWTQPPLAKMNITVHNEFLAPKLKIGIAVVGPHRNPGPVQIELCVNGDERMLLKQELNMRAIECNLFTFSFGAPLNERFFNFSLTLSGNGVPLNDIHDNDDRWSFGALMGFMLFEADDLVSETKFMSSFGERQFR